MTTSRDTVSVIQTHPFLHVGSSLDLTGRDRILYRAFEMVPGILSLGTLLLLVILSFTAPTYAAYFTIIFSIYWLYKSLYLSIHLRHNFNRLRHAQEVDWSGRLHNIKSDDIVHIVLFPFYKESYEVVKESMEALRKSDFPLIQIVPVLAGEARAGESAYTIQENIRNEYKDIFLDVLITTHPTGVRGELPGKGSNIAYAAEEVRKTFLDQKNIPYTKTIVSAFDIDTVVYPKYFSCLTWHFLTAERPHHVSFQPVPLYNNNIWSAPTLSRVLAYSSSFWQMIQQERPEKLATFSSHALSFEALYRGGYWQKNIVSEDSRIFWNLFFANDGDYEVVPLSYPVSMDANVAETWWKTIVNLYRQHRRWTWGVENIPYILFQSVKNPRVPLGKRLRAIFVQMEGFWSLATHPLILFAFGWLPLIVGGRAFQDSVLSYNLPIVAKGFLTLAMVGLIFSAIFMLYLIPKRTAPYTRKRTVLMAVQWILIPFTMVFFSAIPGLESQIRLMIGRPLGFWVTPKNRV